VTIGLAAGRRWLVRHWADPLYRQSYLMLASTGVSAVTGLLFWVVAARRVDPAVLGAAAGLFAANAFLSYLTGFGLPYAMLRFGASDRVTARLNASLAFSAATSLGAAVLFAVATPLVSPELAPHLRHWWPDLVLFAVAGIGAGAGVLVDNLLAARQRAGTVLARNAAAGVLKVAALPWLPVDDPRPLYLAVTLPVAVTVLVTMIALPRLVPGYRLTLGYRPIAGYRRDPAVRETVSFAAKSFPGALLSGAPQFALPLLAVSMLGVRENAFFYVAWSIAQIAYLVPAVVSNISLSQGTSASAGALAARGRRFAALLLAPAVVVGVALPGPVLGLYGAEYANGAAAPLRLLMLGVLPWTVVVLAQSRLRTEHRFRALTALTAVFCALSLVLPVTVGLVSGSGTGMAAGLLAAALAAALLAGYLTRISHHGLRRGDRTVR
jgi:O-antigen/teichoic acid export membrane protein